MNVNDLLKKRRTIYRLKKEMPVSEAEVIKLVTEATALVPDSFDMKSQRVVIVSGEKQNVLWDTIYDVFGGKVSREKSIALRLLMGLCFIFMMRMWSRRCKKMYLPMPLIFRSGPSRRTACFRFLSGRVCGL